MCAILNQTVVNHVVLYWADCVWVMVCHAEQFVMNDMSQWLWIMVRFAGIKHHDSQPLAHHNSLWLNHSHSITHNQSQSLAQHYTPWFKTTGPAKRTIIHNHWLISFMTNCSAWHTITQTQSAQYKTTWFTTVRWTSGLESWCGMLSQWLWIMVCYTDPVDVNHVCYTEPNSCESCCFILSQLCLSYGVSCRAAGYEWYESVVMNYGAFCWTSGPESWCVMLSKWLWLMVCNAEQVVVHNCSVQYSTHDSHPLGQYNTPWFTTTGSALHTMTQDHWSSKMHNNSQPLTHIIHNQLLGMTHHNSNTIGSV
jgi:hypothetical protein